ncbi:MAG TPA: hypothetical protein VM120_02910 [Bryobacteraceae bacterium]|nr:hypothetical protein [Bryobacteraceae bacterium]
MRFLRRAQGVPPRLGVLPGAFHPPTRAHLALAQAALDSLETDEVLFVLPAEFPHKKYEAVNLDQRLDMLAAATRQDPRFSIAVSTGGLFLEIARECREAYGADVRLRFLCGRDTAERIVGWNYSGQPAIDEQLYEYELLVAPRQGGFATPPRLSAVIQHLPVDPSHDEVSSSEVRERIARGDRWEHLVPEAIVRQVRERYGG